MIRIINLATWLSPLLSVMSGQSPSLLRFEVTSVKPTPVDRQNLLRPDFCTTGGRFSVAATPVMWSLSYAYQIRDYQIVGAPDWLNDFAYAYDIDGRPAEAVSNEDCRLMLQSLFRDRFGMSAHWETKDAPVYQLTVGKNGSKLHGRGPVRINGSVQLTGPGKPQWPDGLTMPALAAILSNYTDRPVVDRTGLDGPYGITLNFSRTDSDGQPSIFTAVQEQLGLKLDAGRGPIQILTIDHIQKPDPN